MTLVTPIPEPIDIQETLDLYTSHRCKVRILSSHEVNKKITAIRTKYEDLTRSERKRYGYIDKLLSTERSIGLPCGLCFDMILIGSKCIIKKGGTNTKSYHYSCARSINII